MKIPAHIIALSILSLLLISCCIPQKTKFELHTSDDFRLIRIERTEIWNEIEQGSINTFAYDTLYHLSKYQKKVLRNKLKNATEFCLLIKPGTPASTSYLVESKDDRVFVMNTGIIHFKGDYYRTNMYFFCKRIFSP